jgi:hypothetical protein
MFKNYPAIFGGIVAYILLVLYAGTVVYMTKSVIQHGLAGAPKDKDGKELAKAKLEFTPGIVYVVTTVGGLVSALVIAKLAVTKPGENPTLVQTTEDISEQAKKLADFLIAGYMLVWLATGFTALLVGVMFFPNYNNTLGEIGTTWLGLAVASGYAYFGLNPNR